MIGDARNDSLAGRDAVHPTLGGLTAVPVFPHALIGLWRRSLGEPTPLASSSRVMKHCRRIFPDERFVTFAAAMAQHQCARTVAVSVVSICCPKRSR